MKGALFALLFFTAMSSCCDCEEESAPLFNPGNFENGWASGIKNGCLFNASCEAGFYPFEEEGYDSLSIKVKTYEAYDSFWIPRETISFYPIPLKIGRNDVYIYQNEKTRTGSTYGILDDDGHGTESYYVVKDDEDNWIELTEIDTVNGILQGKIQCTYQKAYEDSSPNPDICRFRDLRFAVKYPL